MLGVCAALLYSAGAIDVAGQNPDSSAVICTAVSAPAGLPGIAGRRADYLRAVSLRSRHPSAVLIRRPSHEAASIEVPCDEPWRLGSGAVGAEKVAYTAAVYLDAGVNSGYPHGVQTGLLWPGRGAHAMWTAGVDYRAGPLHVGLFPQLAWQQNRAFSFVPFAGDSGSIYAYRWAPSATGHHPRIDWPQRHGDDAFFSTSFGQSFVSLELAGVRAGVSTENLWWGPAQRNSILLGNDAPGFPHVFIGTPRGIATPIGRVAAELVWGRLTESDYFNADPEDDHRFFSGLVVSIQPRWVTGLSLGAARLYYQPYEQIGIADLLPFLETPFKLGLITPDNPRGENVADQLFALFLRYALPATGFEVYGEWARNDHSQNLRDFFAEPDHSRAYTLGFQQVIVGRARWYRVRGEITQLGLSKTIAHRPTPRYYVHHLVRQGYTHRGQLLGASIGPGAEAQFLGFDMLTRRGSHDVFVERVRYDEDAFYTYVSPRYDFTGHDAELTAGTNHFMRLRPLELSAGLSYSMRFNRGFRYCNPTTPIDRDCRDAQFRDSNWQLALGLGWRVR